jgi:hypothetical protein
MMALRMKGRVRSSAVHDAMASRFQDALHRPDRNSNPEGNCRQAHEFKVHEKYP